MKIEKVHDPIFPFAWEDKTIVEHDATRPYFDIKRRYSDIKNGTCGLWIRWRVHLETQEEIANVVVLKKNLREMAELGVLP